MKKFISITLVLVLLFAMAVPVTAGNGNNARVEGDMARAEGFGFHCSTFGGNGRTYVPQFQAIGNNGKVNNINTNKIWVDLIRTVDPVVWYAVVPEGENWACINCGSSAWITFSNKSGVPDGKNVQLTHPEQAFGTFEIKKYVDGTIITEWEIPQGYSVSDLIAGFDLYATSGRGAELGDFVGRCDFDAATGIITYSRALPIGWYAIQEVLTEAGKAIFEEPEPFYILIGEGSNNIMGKSNGFDYGVLYTVGYDWHAMIRALGLDGLNGGGEVFPLWLNAPDGSVHDSFCACPGSLSFAGDSPFNPLDCKGYMVAQNGQISGAYDDFVSAYNYIMDNYGNLSENRLITQIVSWSLIRPDLVNAAIISGNASLSDDEKAAIIDVLSNSKGYSGRGLIVDVVYLVCEDPEHDYTWCQPQLVPVYGGEIVFNNILRAVA
jgi:hypothetical protein